MPTGFLRRHLPELSARHDCRASKVRSAERRFDGHPTAAGELDPPPATELCWMCCGHRDSFRQRHRPHASGVRATRSRSGVGVFVDFLAAERRVAGAHRHSGPPLHRPTTRRRSFVSDGFHAAVQSDCRLTSNDELRAALHGRKGAVQTAGDRLRSRTSAPKCSDPPEPFSAGRPGRFDEVRSTKKNLVLDRRDVPVAARVVMICQPTHSSRDRLTSVGVFSWHAVPSILRPGGSFA